MLDLFRDLAKKATADIQVVCQCCKAFYSKEDFRCRCVVYTEAYKAAGNREEGEWDYEAEGKWLDENYDTIGCFGSCTIEGIMGSVCRRCGTYVSIDHLVCPHCVELVLERYGYNPLAKQLSGGGL